MPPGRAWGRSDRRGGGSTFRWPLACRPVRARDGDVVQVDALADATDEYVVAVTGMVQQAGRFPGGPG